MAGIIDTVLGQLGGGGLSTVAGALGLGSEDQAKSAVTTAVTVLTGALAQNASKPEGASALDGALERDHDGSIFDNIGGFLADFTSGPGAGILGHVLGSKQPTVEKAIADQSGLSLDKVAPLLVMVAPMVMGALGKLKKDKAMGAQDVATTLAGESEQAAKGGDSDLLGTVIGALGGMAGSSAPSTSGSKGGLGGLLGAIGGLFKKKG